jgi:hypothetical protein
VLGAGLDASGYDGAVEGAGDVRGNKTDQASDEDPRQQHHRTVDRTSPPQQRPRHVQGDAEQRRAHHTLLKNPLTEEQFRHLPVAGGDAKSIS